MSFDRSKLYLYKSPNGGYYATCTDCKGVANHTLNLDGFDAPWSTTAVHDSKSNSDLTHEAIKFGFDRHVNWHVMHDVVNNADRDVKDKAPLSDPLDELKALLDDAVKEYAPKLQKVLTDFGLKTFLK